MTKRLRPPFGWVGGKSKLIDDLLPLIPPHSHYLEVFGGGLALLYAKREAPITKTGLYRETINDANDHLINLHNIIKNKPQELEDELSDMLVSRTGFNQARKAISKGLWRSKVHQAAMFFYVLQSSFGGKVEHFAMPKNRRSHSVRSSFQEQSKRLQGVTIECLNFDTFIETYDNEDSFFYCDPPYVTTESQYTNIERFTKEDHILLAELLSKIIGKFLLSYNDCELVRELYKDFYITQSKEIGYGVNAHSKKQQRELLITNYDPKALNNQQHLFSNLKEYKKGLV